MLRGDIVKDDSMSCAVFTEQGSSASQMTAAEVMDMVKMEDAPKIIENSKIGMPRHLDSSTTIEMA